MKSLIIVLACTVTAFVFFETAMERYLTPTLRTPPALDSLGLPALPPGLQWVPADPADTMPPLWPENPRAQYQSHA